VKVYEPEGAWSLANLLADHGTAALAAFQRAYPELSSSTYGQDADIEQLIADCDTVIVHEWNEPWVVAGLGRARRRGGHFVLLFHDTHHRAVSDPAAMRRLDLSDYDGVLAFGEALAEVYRGWGWGRRAFVWHEAADTRLFRPPETDGERSGLVWIGNWGDEERSSELEEFLLRPAAEAQLPLDVYGVRYPEAALAMLARFGARYRGWLPNAEVPSGFARHVATVHVPRRFYVDCLPGIPTIRVFEALACGIPLVCSPWQDTEQLFGEGAHYLVAHDGDEMVRQFRALKEDPDLRQWLVENGLATIAARHSCAHRARELAAIVQRVTGQQELELTA
jgi:spore maturation protein CgeB